jgi:hypothetical protein
LDDINIAPYSRSIGLLIKSYAITTALGLDGAIRMTPR